MVVDGKKLANEILTELKIEMENPAPQLRGGILAAVLVGNEQSSISFLKQKSKIAKFLGVNFKISRFGGKIGTKKLCEKILKLNKNKKTSGIIVQLPLPKNIKTDLVLKAVNPKKDIDALSQNPLVLAPTVEAVKFIFGKYKINYKNKNILIVGRGRLVGQPIYNWLNAQKSYRQSMRSEMKIKIIDVEQKNQLPKLARKADIIISGVGKAGLINGNMVKNGLPAGRHGAILIDFGFDRKNGPPKSEVKKIYGDFEFESCAKKAKFITPVPGGMGPIMVAMLFKNLLKLNKL